MNVSVAGFTDVGESRDHNEDGLLLFVGAAAESLETKGRAGGMRRSHHPVSVTIVRTIGATVEGYSKIHK